MGKAKPEPRRRLTRERVLEVALRVADAEGIEALSMRRLAAELGVEAMSLYNHVSSKADLLSAVLDRAIADFELPAAGGAGEWKPWVREWMRCARAVFTRHPHLFRIVLGDTPLGPNTLRMIDALFARLQAAGFDDRAQLRTWEVLRAYLFGTLVQERIQPAEMSPAAFLECCPHLVRVMSLFGCCDPELLFEEGLDTVLAGLARTAHPG